MKRFAAVMASAAMLAVPMLSGCAGGAVVSCTGKANNVHHSSGTSTAMVGKATGKCSGGAVSISGFVEIQQKKSGKWVSYKRSYFEFVATPGTTFTRQAATQCRKGTFRTHSYVVGTYKGESETRVNDSGETVNPCS